MTELKNKMLEQLQTWDMSLDACIEFLQQMELIDQFIKTQENAHVYQVNTTKEKEGFDICKYCKCGLKRTKNNFLPLDKFAKVKPFFKYLQVQK